MGDDDTQRLRAEMAYMKAEYEKWKQEQQQQKK